MTETIVAIRQNGPSNFSAIILWPNSKGPHFIDSNYKTRDQARREITKITGPNRKLQSLDRLYEETDKRIHEDYMKYKEPNRE